MPAALLDGRNRLDAMELVGIEVIRDGELIAIEPCGIAWIDPALAYEYVFSANFHRRHLTSEQKDDVTAKWLRAKPETLEPGDRQAGQAGRQDGCQGPARARDVRKFLTSKPGPTPRAASSPPESRVGPRTTSAGPREEESYRGVRSTPRSNPQACPARRGRGIIDEATASMIKPKRPASTAARKKRDLDGPMVPAANPIGAAWEAATEEQRVEFSDFYGDEVKARRPPVTVRVEMPVVEKAEPVSPGRTPALPRQNAAEPVTVKVEVPAIKEEVEPVKIAAPKTSLPTPRRRPLILSGIQCSIAGGPNHEQAREEGSDVREPSGSDHAQTRPRHRAVLVIRGPAEDWRIPIMDGRLPRAWRDHSR